MWGKRRGKTEGLQRRGGTGAVLGKMGISLTANVQRQEISRVHSVWLECSMHEGLLWDRSLGKREFDWFVEGLGMQTKELRLK